MINEFILTLKRWFIKWAIWAGIFALIVSIWTVLEVAELGKNIPTATDTLIAAILACSLYKNLNIKVLEQIGGTRQ